MVTTKVFSRTASFSVTVTLCALPIQVASASFDVALPLSHVASANRVAIDEAVVVNTADLTAFPSVTLIVYDSAEAIYWRGVCPVSLMNARRNVEMEAKPLSWATYSSVNSGCSFNMGMLTRSMRNWLT